ncbi:MAG: glycosyltransferase family 2 protein [bacterium]|nr:glycosyltransferase family 2 protein [bacterium]
MSSNNSPLVSVICLCYNHADYVSEAIQSVIDQTYQNIELIIVDDASTDHSVKVIEGLIAKLDNTQTIYNSHNLGNCKSFNIGLKASKGKYVIDLAADDLLHPERIAIGIKKLQESTEEYGVHYSPIVRIDQNGSDLGNHLTQTYDGDIYKLLIEKFIISAPSMMIKRTVLQDLNGYDEQLSYEDYDFWIRSSRKYLYASNPESLTYKRELQSGLAKKQYRILSKHLTTTYKVCKKIFNLNQNKSEDTALLRRLKYELKHTVLNFRLDLSLLYCLLYIKTKLRRF